MPKKSFKVEDGDSIRFFGESDRKANGEIKSFRPGWSQRHRLEDLQEKADSIKRRRKLGAIQEDAMESQMRMLKQIEDQLDKIKSEKPKLNAAKRNKLGKARENLGEQITSLFPTASQMSSGEGVRIQQEVDMKVTPLVDVPSEISGFIDEFGIMPDKKTGKITRDQACKAWQILGYTLDEDTDTETLRKGGGGYREGDPGKNYIIRNKHTEADEVLAQDSKRNDGYEVRL